MSEGLLQNNFTEDINQQIIKRVIYLVNIILFLSVIYSGVVLLDWYVHLQRYFARSHQSINYYDYIITPVIAFIILAVHIISWVLYLKGHQSVYASVQDNDAGHFNKGYKIYLRSLQISLIGSSITIIKVILNLFIKSQL